MIRLGNHDAAQAAQKVRDEMTAAREHLLSAAEQGAHRLGESSRRTRRVAQERATLAARVLRGERPASPWRWLGIGLTAGAALGAAVVLAARRWREPAEEALREYAGPMVERAQEATAKVRDTAQEVTREATERAQEVAHQAKDRVTGAKSAAERTTSNARPVPDPDPSPQPGPVTP